MLSVCQKAFLGVVINTVSISLIVIARNPKSSPNMAGGALTVNRRITKKRRKKRQYHYHNHRHHPHQNLSTLIPLLTSATTAARTFLSHHDLDLLPSQTLTLESKITSTAISLSKLQTLLQTQPLSQPLASLPPPSSTQCWFQRFLSFSASDTQWVESFRMSKPSFDLLLETLTPTLQNSTSTLSPDYALGAALYRLAHAASYQSVGKRFGVNSPTACRAFYVVCKAVIDQLSHLFEFGSDMGRIIEGFDLFSFPNCCGILGFSRFLCDGLELGKEGGFVVQGLVDSEGRFLDVSAGWPSSMTPSMILPETKLFSRVEESRELLNGDSIALRGGDWIPQYILGDSCCPLLPWLLTPFPETSDEAEMMFNSAHGRAMGLVTTAFGRVKAQWKLLSVKWEQGCVDSFPFVIVAACLLHNFLIKCNEVVPDEIEVDSWKEGFPMFQGKDNENGETIRDALALQLGLNEEGQVSTFFIEEDTRPYEFA